MKLLTASAPTMKHLNKSTILSLIRDAGSISRSEIAVSTGLTKPTITNLVGELLEEGLVVEQGQGQSTGGRKPTYVSLNPEARYIVGVDVGINEMRIIALDLRATIKFKKNYEIPNITGNEQFLRVLGDNIEDSISHLIESTNIDLQRVLGIGIGMHGIVDANMGTSIFAPILQLNSIHIRDYLTHRFGIDVLVDNDVRAMAAGERWFGEAQSLSDFIFVNVGVGVGAAIVIQGEMVRGANGSAGEIGHIVVEPGGALCSCGKRGCLETVCSAPALARQAVELVQSRRGGSLIPALVGGDLSRVTGLTVFAAAEQGDPLARQLFESVGYFLGKSIASLINALNPEAVIVGGGLSRAGEHLFAPMRRSVDVNALDVPRSSVRIIPSSLPDNSTAFGAASMVLSTIFSPDL